MATATDQKMLHLQLPTDPRWADIAEKNLVDILQDHAYCEQKAASTCISLIVQYPEREKLVEALTPVVAEEWSHFEMVLDKLRARGAGLGRPRKDEYVGRLMQHVRKGERERQLLDKLLVSALIEARSCERFKLLWKQLDDAELQQFYYQLMVSEAGHYVNFLELARHYAGREVADARWQEFLALEADIIATLEVRADRMH